MPTKPTSEIEQESAITSLLAELRSKLSDIGDKDCLATLDKLEQAVADESGTETEERPMVDASIESEVLEEEETSEEEAAEPVTEEKEEVAEGEEIPIARKGKKRTAPFDMEGM